MRTGEAEAKEKAPDESNGVCTALPEGYEVSGVIGANASSSEKPDTTLGTDELLIVRALWAVG